MARYPEPFKGMFSTPGPSGYKHKRLSVGMTLGVASPLRANPVNDMQPFSPKWNLAERSRRLANAQ